MVLSSLHLSPFIICVLYFIWGIYIYIYRERERERERESESAGINIFIL
jgi:hypothetical protein